MPATKNILGFEWNKLVLLSEIRICCLLRKWDQTLLHWIVRYIVRYIVWSIRVYIYFIYVLSSYKKKQYVYQYINIHTAILT